MGSVAAEVSHLSRFPRATAVGEDHWHTRGHVAYLTVTVCKICRRVWEISFGLLKISHCQKQGGRRASKLPQLSNPYSSPIPQETSRPRLQPEDDAYTLFPFSSSASLPSPLCRLCPGPQMVSSRYSLADRLALLERGVQNGWAHACFDVVDSFWKCSVHQALFLGHLVPLILAALLACSVSLQSMFLIVRPHP